MSLQTESGAPILTESQDELLTESESASSPLQAKATLTLRASGDLLKYCTLRAKATLKLTARQLDANAIPGPSGLNALMKIVTDPINPALVLDQYLLLWFYAHPSQCQVSLQIDDEAESQPAWAWENPGNTQPAIIKIDSAEIPGDGMTHRLRLYVRYAIAGKISAPTLFTLTGKLNPKDFLETPEWCGATLIRQGETLITDLTEIKWRHPGAVRIVAKYKTLNAARTAWIETETTVGYADYDDETCLIDNIGVKLWTGSNVLRDVTFGVAAIRRNQFGPVQWAAAPIGIQSRHPNDTGTAPLQG